MAITKLSSREFNQDTSRAKRAAKRGPVFITDRGRPSHVLLTAEEYRDSINGFNLDQSIAIRIGKMIGDPTLTEYAFNRYPLYLVGPWNLAQRFLMHGFFTEHLYARLEQSRLSAALPQLA